jgi:hypothetical protein
MKTKLRKLTQKMSTAVGRQLLSHALQAACLTKDLGALKELVDFIKKD